MCTHAMPDTEPDVTLHQSAGKPENLPWRYLAHRRPSYAITRTSLCTALTSTAQHARLLCWKRPSN